MKYHIEKQLQGISVRIEGISGEEKALLDAVSQCRQSAWACPSGECLNIETTEARAEQGSVLLTLTPRAGVQLNLSAIEECLSYTLHQAVKG
jgi:hypothetical protein